ncbi:MAG: tyrosine-type recombinase/integrase [Bacillota bacterium]
MNLKDLNIAYLGYLKYEKHSSPRSIPVRMSEFNMFQRYMQEKGIDEIGEIKTHHLRSYISHLRMELAYQPVSISNVISGLRAFYSFAVKKGVVPANIALKLKKPQVGQKEVEHFSWDEVERLFMALPHNAKFTRNICILLLLYYTGVRLEELSQIKISDLSDDLSELHIEHGKGDKSRLLPVHSILQRALRVYLPTVKTQGSTWLFPGRAVVKPLSTNRIYKIVKDCGEKAGINKRVSPHTFRHSFATHLHQKGVDIYRLMELLGHVNIEKTAIYTHIKDDELTEAIKKLE